MKNLLSTLLLALFFVSGIQAQTVLDQGYLVMEITEVSSDDEQAAAMLQMMKGSQTEIFFKDGKNMSSMDMMGGMVKVKSLFQQKTGSVDMLMDMMGQKMHIQSNKDDMMKATADQADAMEGFEVKYDEADTKEILGHKCVKAEIIDPSTKKATMIMYVARDIKADSKMLQGMQHFDIDGFPLEMIIKQPQMSMTMSTVKLEKEVDDSVFALKTDGYTKMTFQEFMDKMGAMGGGGFGF
jgi:hypothetical protein